MNVGRRDVATFQKDGGVVQAGVSLLVSLLIQTPKSERWASSHPTGPRRFATGAKLFGTQGSHQKGNATGQAKIRMIRVKTQEGATQDLLDLLSSPTLGSSIVAGVAILVDLNGQLLLGQVKVDPETRHMLLEFEGHAKLPGPDLPPYDPLAGAWY